MAQQSELFPFTYTIRESAKAKRLQLRITLRHGLEVVIPKRLASKVDLCAFLQEKRCWIERHLALQASSDHSIHEREPLPKSLLLRGIEESWTVAYLSGRSFELIENALRQLTLLGNANNIARCHQVLIGWLKRKAEAHLAPLLSELSRETSLTFRSVQIRAQQTRWGSCSSKGEISLNYQLLFLPSSLVRHILLHELVHTRYLHHGVRFWQLLGKLDSNTKEHAYQARRAHQYVPNWIVSSASP